VSRESELLSGGDFLDGSLDLGLLLLLGDDGSLFLDQLFLLSDFLLVLALLGGEEIDQLLEGDGLRVVSNVFLSCGLDQFLEGGDFDLEF